MELEQAAIVSSGVVGLTGSDKVLEVIIRAPPSEEAKLNTLKSEILHLFHKMK